MRAVRLAGSRINRLAASRWGAAVPREASSGVVAGTRRSVAPSPLVSWRSSSGTQPRPGVPGRMQWLSTTSVLASTSSGRGAGAPASPPGPAPSPSSSSSSSSSPTSMPGVKALLEHYDSVPLERVRNFCIIAHIDHGKSTLADKLLESVGNIVPTTKSTAQVLDTLQVERERGITVKAQSASMLFVNPKDNLEYLINLIDTPGHVDFTYEVSRSLAACQGALLLVDSTQGVQAQTLANFNSAKEAKLAIIPVLTKIDLPHADPEPAMEQMQSMLGLDPHRALWTSAKSGAGIGDVLPAIIEGVPRPPGSRSNPLRCLLFDSWFDEYRGVICIIQVVDGELRPGMRVRLAHSGVALTVQEVGIVTPARVSVPLLAAGHVGYVITGMRNPKDALTGDTFLDESNPGEPLAGFQRAKPMVFASLFPVDTTNFEELRDAVEKLCLTDPSVTVTKENSSSLGFGLRCGFLGLLHMDVFHQRLSDEFDMPVITTAPMVPYNLRLKNGTTVTVERPDDFPSPNEVEDYFEPMVTATIMTPSDFLSNVLGLMQEHRGLQQELHYLENGRVFLRYRMPWQEVVLNFFDRLKSVTQGYATFDYEPTDFQASDIVKVDILLNHRPLDALSFVAHRSRAEYEGRRVTERLRKVIRRQQFEVIIQAAVGNKIFAKERIPPFRKDVLTKGGKTVGGGDVTRKRKLLEKQKRGKARMKSVGDIELSQEAFHAVMSREES